MHWPVSLSDFMDIKTLSSDTRGVNLYTEGTVYLFSLRVLTALQSLAAEYIKWPDAEERMQIARAIGNCSPFSKCVGFVDGSLINLWARPSVNGDHYVGYKSQYSLNSMAIVDQNKKIRYLNLGWVGCADDQKVMATSNVSCQDAFDAIRLVTCCCAAQIRLFR